MAGQAQREKLAVIQVYATNIVNGPMESINVNSLFGNSSLNVLYKPDLTTRSSLMYKSFSVHCCDHADSADSELLLMKEFDY